MPGPTLTTQEIAQLTQDKATQTNTQNVMNAAIPAQTAKAAQQLVSDGAFKKFFDYYNTNIIGEYDAEREALNGQYNANPITEADIVGAAQLNGAVRTTPTPPATSIVRVPEFDGGNLITNPLNETQYIANQAAIETALVSGYGTAHFNATTCVTASALTSSSTTLMLTDPTNPISIVANDIFIVYSLSDMAVVKVTTVTPTGTPPPYTVTLGITLLLAPAGTLAIGSSMEGFTGFTNSERTTKTPVNSALQPLMNSLVTQLQTAINGRITSLNSELAALAANQDPDGTANIATATSNDTASKTFLTSYLGTTDISDTGLAELASDRSTRGAQITARLAQIVAAYTGQTQNYYNERYTFANNRANSLTGTLRLYYASQAAISQLGTYSAAAAGAVTAINSILP